MKTKALLFIVFATLALLAYLHAFQSVPTDALQVPTQAIVKQYYSNSQRALDNLGEGTPTKGKQQ